MGYTHYWTVPATNEAKEAFEKALPYIQKIVEEHKDLICLEYDCEDEAPRITPEGIRFNGKGEAGFESFIIAPNGQWTFCKTARKLYDLPVCKVLLVLFVMVPGMTLSSDGWRRNQKLDENWPEAVEAVERWGFRFIVTRNGALEPHNTPPPA